MSNGTGNPHPSGSRRPWKTFSARVEGLEPRALMAVTTPTFQAPDLTDLFQAAARGVNTGPAAIDRMVQALHDQLTSGPLADLKAGTVDAAGFEQEVASLLISFDASADTLFLPKHPNIDNLVKLQATRIGADIASLNQQTTVGLSTTDQLSTNATTAIDDLTSGTLKPLGTAFSALAQRTQTFETDLNTLAQTLASGATPSLTIAQVSTTLNAEAEAYRADVSGSLYLHPNINQAVNNAVTTLETQVNTIAQSGASDAQTQVQAAIAAFDAALLDTTGLFGPSGPLARRLSGS